ncbi:MAG: ABC transporter permease [Anaerolineaceae bacterium]|nr:ABC transporter permease [Anaerolineaceae bacterium]
MKHLNAALWTETLKIRRSIMPLITLFGISMAPLAVGLFMVILKDPDAAQSMGLISMKAQLVVGTADWPTFFDMLSQTIAIGGFVLFSILTIWVFGREFSDRTSKDFLALPTSRNTIIAAKLIVSAVWAIALTLWVYAFGILIGYLIDIPGWSSTLLQSSLVDYFGSALLTIVLMPFVAFFASIGRGYMLPFGWTILTLILAQLVAYTGWGEFFPWAIPAIFSGAAGPRDILLEPHSYTIMLLACVISLAATFWWWRSADQTR